MSYSSTVIRCISTRARSMSKGDGKCASIAAGFHCGESRGMSSCRYAESYPEYHFAENKEVMQVKPTSTPSGAWAYTPFTARFSARRSRSKRCSSKVFRRFWRTTATFDADEANRCLILVRFPPGLRFAGDIAPGFFSSQEFATYIWLLSLAFAAVNCHLSRKESARTLCMFWQNASLLLVLRPREGASSRRTDLSLVAEEDSAPKQQAQKGSSSKKNMHNKDLGRKGEEAAATRETWLRHRRAQLTCIAGRRTSSPSMGTPSCSWR